MMGMEAATHKGDGSTHTSSQQEKLKLPMAKCPREARFSGRPLLSGQCHKSGARKEGKGEGPMTASASMQVEFSEEVWFGEYVRPGLDLSTYVFLAHGWCFIY